MTTTLFTKNKSLIVSVLLVVALAVPVMVGASSVPTLDIDFSSALTTIFDYAEMIFAALIGIAAIGIGFRFGGALITWVGGMLGDALRFR
jgi:hypothetical protein